MIRSLAPALLLRPERERGYYPGKDDSTTMDELITGAFVLAIILFLAATQAADYLRLRRRRRERQQAVRQANAIVRSKQQAVKISGRPTDALQGNLRSAGSVVRSVKR